MLRREDILPLVPHQGDMCLWDEVLAWSASDIVLRAHNHRDPAHPLRSDGRLRISERPAAAIRRCRPARLLPPGSWTAV